jgi:hypothetical protein
MHYLLVFYYEHPLFFWILLIFPLNLIRLSYFIYFVFDL